MNDRDSFAQLLQRKINQLGLTENATEVHSTSDPSASPSATPENLVLFNSSFKWDLRNPISRQAKAKQVYKVTPRPRPPIILSPIETHAFDQLTAIGAELPNPFSKKQLQRVKRQLALRHHPDMGGSQALFIDIQSWICRLEKRAL